MKFVSLNLTESDNYLLKSNSILNNFPEFNIFHFSISSKLSINDQKYLLEQGYSFFNAQFNNEIQEKILIYDKKEEFSQFNKSKELSWEIFFRYNQFIKVCEGVYDETLDWFISGFIGKIIDFYIDNNKNIFFIELSPKSLSAIPESHLRSILESNSFIYTFLSSDLIMPAPNLANQETLERNLIGLIKKVKVNHNRILINQATSIIDLIEKWENIFKDNLSNPIISRTYSDRNQNIQLIDIPYSERKFGVWGTFTNRNNVFDLPLLDISEIYGNNTFNQLLVDYKNQITPLLPN